MKKKHLMISALLAAMMASAPSFAQDHGDRDHGSWSQGNDNRGGDNHGNDNRGNDNRGNDNRGGYAAHGGDRHGDGAGPEHSWHRGDRLPDRYRSNQYVVNDWRGHHLRQPPRGYHWVQSGSDYVLAAVATGVIADLIVNSR